MNFTMAQLGNPGITCGHVQDEPLWPPPECPLSNTYSHTTQTSRYGPQTNRPSHCLWLCRCWGGRLSSRKADKEGWLFFFSCLFSHLLQQFSVAENLGMERSTVAKRKKKVFMNNGTLQIHLVPRHFFFLSFSLQPII